MIPKEVYNYSIVQLIDWLRHEAGSSNPDYFHAKKTGGLKLQQVPEEYSRLLLLLKESNVKTYLELGIGNGGSFEVACFFMKETLIISEAVDNLAYGRLIDQTEAEIQARITRIKEDYVQRNNISAFHNLPTDAFFKNLPADVRYNAIFIDADHSYEGAKRDYENSLKHISKGGLIIFHDINSAACPGIMKLWQEVRQGKTNWEFIASKTCGIGVIKL